MDPFSGETISIAIVGGVAAAGAFVFDALLAQPNVVAGRQLLKQAPFGIPPTTTERRFVKDYGNVVASISMGLESGVAGDQPHVFLGKYGRHAVRLLANPYFQDQALQNPVRWRGAVNFGKKQLKEPFTGKGGEHNAQDTLIYAEADRFVVNFEDEVRACRATSHSLAAAVGTDYFVKCDATRRMLGRHPPAHDP